MKPTVNADPTPDEWLAQQLSRYERSGRPITVNFRELGRSYGFPDSATHLIHPYPAKLLPHIPRILIAARMLSSPGDIVLDPFCGSGTVLLEAVLAGRRAIGADANPLARLIAAVKVYPLERQRLRKASQRLARSITRRRATLSAPQVVNLDHWFYPHVVRQLSEIKSAILSTRDRQLRAFFLVCFSVCVRKVSRSDPRLSVPVRLRHDQYPIGHPLRKTTETLMRRLKRINVAKVFFAIVEANIERVARLCDRLPTVTQVDILSNAMRLETSAGAPLEDGSVDLIVTSPPYLGAQKYIRASSLSLGWLGLAHPSQLAHLESLSIGREHFRAASYGTALSHSPTARRRLKALGRSHATRAHLAAVYLIEMQRAVVEMFRVLRPGAHAVLVCGDNSLCGQPFRTSRHLLSLLTSAGFIVRLRLVDTIQSRGLMTKRNKTAGLIAREWVYLVHKPETL